jgi:hypothetical protein
MLKLTILAAAAAILTAGSPASAKEKTDQPKERKVCRTVRMSDRITPQRVCRKIERPAADEPSQRDTREADQPGDRRE